MTLISKIAGGACVLSYISDIHNTAKVYSNNAYAKASSDAYIACDINAQKADRLSSRDAKRKNWLMQHTFFIGIKETLARVGGYIKGFGMGIINHMPEVVLSALAIASKNKKVANISTIALGAYEVYDFAKHSTSLGQKTDYLK